MNNLAFVDFHLNFKSNFQILSLNSHILKIYWFLEIAARHLLYLEEREFSPVFAALEISRLPIGYLSLLTYFGLLPFQFSIFEAEFSHFEMP